MESWHKSECIVLCICINYGIWIKTRTNITIFSASRSVHRKRSKIFSVLGESAEQYKCRRRVTPDFDQSIRLCAYTHLTLLISIMNGPTSTEERESHSEWSRSVTHLILTSVELFESRLTLTQDQKLTEVFCEYKCFSKQMFFFYTLR